MVRNDCAVPWVTVPFTTMAEAWVGTPKWPPTARFLDLFGPMGELLRVSRMRMGLSGLKPTRTQVPGVPDATHWKRAALASEKISPGRWLPLVGGPTPEA